MKKLHYCLPPVLLGILLGVLSVQLSGGAGGSPMIYQFPTPLTSIFESIIILIMLMISAFLIKALLNGEAASQSSPVRRKNMIILTVVHVAGTLLLSLHFALISSNPYILILVLSGLLLLGIGTALINHIKSADTIVKKIHSELFSQPIAGVFLPMCCAYFTIANEAGLLPFLIIVGITITYTGFTLFNQLITGIRGASSPNKPGMWISPSRTQVIDWETQRVAEELGINDPRALGEIRINIYNLHNEEAFTDIPFEERIIFLPHCLRKADRCKGKYGQEGLRCRRCTPGCAINILTSEAERLGYKWFVVPGGEMVFNLARRYRPSGVVAVACLNELKEGSAKTDSEYYVPFQMVPLGRDGCVNTYVNIDEVIKIMNM